MSSIFDPSAFNLPTFRRSHFQTDFRFPPSDDFIHKIAICEKEAAENEYWLELLLESRHAQGKVIEWLIIESRELLANFVASGKTAKSRR